MENKKAEIILENIKSRRSIRKFFSDKPIEPEILNKIYEAARWSPTNCNKQLWKLIIIDDQKLKERLVKEAGSSTLILKAPIIMCVIHYNDVYLEAYQTTAIVTQNVMLMANALGLGTLFLNSKGNIEKIKEILHIPENYIVTNFILLGYYDREKKHIPPKRKPISHFIMKNHFNAIDEIEWSHDPAKWNYQALKEYQTYISRKTELGTMQDVFDEEEAQLVRDISQSYGKKHLELFAYDGWIVKASYFDIKESIYTAETSKETILYTKVTLEDKVISYTFEELEKSEEKFDSISINFRLERLSPDLKERVFKFIKTHLNQNGSFYIIGRNQNLFFLIFYKFLLKKLGDNISKTAIFAFFGPYEPLDHKRTLEELRRHGFKVEGKRYYTIPPIFRIIAKLLYQYKLSGGGNFMHRIDRETKLSNFFKTLNIIQKKYNIHFFGSISYFKGKIDA